MGQSLKYLAYTIAALAGLLLVAGISVLLLFDPNDYRDEIEQVVQETTGRELVIEGDISVSIFPWLAIEVGRTQLGNGAGFGDEPFARFENARLSIRLLPMLFSREVEVATAELNALQLNLAVNSSGRSNWQDFVDISNAAAAMPAESDSEITTQTGGLNIAGIKLLDSTIRYSDAQAGGNYVLSDLNIVSGGISSTAVGIDIDGFSIKALLDGVAEVPTTFELETSSISVNTNTEMIALDTVDLDLLGLDVTAVVDAFSYAGDITPTAAIQVDAFSLRSLMQRLAIEAPETSDPTALGKVIIDATAKVGTRAIVLSDLTLVLDETTFKGELSIPQGDNDVFEFDLSADAINLDRYMAPAVEGEGSAAADSGPVEIPADLILLINARGSLKVASAQLSGMQFDNVTLGLMVSDGNLRLHPISATLFEGQYNGDVRIDASRQVPVLSVNERIVGVQLGALAKAMFDQDNISGTINGAFQLSGRGADVAAVQSDLDGKMEFSLLDGAWEGTDIWYELRRARAALRQEEPPQPELPARTAFSKVSASGPVENGVFTNSDLLADLPFMRVTGRGTVNFVAATVDYHMDANVLPKPELLGDDVSDEEIKDLTRAVIPMRISGSLLDPKIAPDFEKLLKSQAKQEVEDKVKDKLKNKLDQLLNK